MWIVTYPVGERKYLNQYQLEDLLDYAENNGGVVEESNGVIRCKWGIWDWIYAKKNEYIFPKKKLKS